MTYWVGMEKERAKICGKSVHLLAYAAVTNQVSFTNAGVIKERNWGKSYESCYWVIDFGPNYRPSASQIGVQIKSQNNLNVFIFEGNRSNATFIGKNKKYFKAGKGKKLLIVSQTFSNASSSSLTF